MKKIKRFILVFLIFSLPMYSYSQLSVDAYGRVGIGKSDPSYKLDLYGYDVCFDYTNYPLLFALGAMDPRIVSTRKVVFYEASGYDHCDIECDDCIETSDSTLKKDIRRIEDGLSLVLQLEGKTFLKKNEKDGIRRSGLIAQEVEKVIPGVVFTNDTSNKYLISYTKLIPYLIEAIKDQQGQINELKSYLNISDAEDNLKSELTSATLNLESTNSLSQNNPNPFNQDTEIEFYITTNINNAALYIYDMQGNQLKSYDIKQRGASSLTIYGSEFHPGMYLYTLIVDGKEVDTKRMILTP